MPDMPRIPYVVDHLARVDEQIQTLADKAARRGVHQEYVRALKSLVDRLRTEPLRWGDQEYNTRREGGVVCHTICPPLIAQYVVYELERVVCILGIKPLPGHVLGHDG